MIDKKSKILYVDPLSPSGHINFNKIYIESLLKIFTSIDFAFKENYRDKLSIHIKNKVYTIPEKLYDKSKSKIINRYNYYKIFRYIKNNCNIHIYDYIIFSSYEEISLYFSKFRKKLILINHNNVSGLRNPIKLFFFRKNAIRNINIVLEDYIKEYLLTLDIPNVYTLYHGLGNPYDRALINNSSLLYEFNYLNNFKFVIFSPSNTSSDNVFLNKLINDYNFTSFLKKNDILLILKSNQIDNKHSNVEIIKNYLSDLQYQYLFLKSNLILLSYPSSFTFRVSAILLECMSNNKLCLISDIPSLNIYKDYFNYSPFFKSIDDLKEKLCIMLKSQRLIISPYKDLSNYKPDFKNMFSTLEKMK